MPIFAPELKAAIPVVGPRVEAAWARLERRRAMLRAGGPAGGSARAGAATR